MNEDSQCNVSTILPDAEIMETKIPTSSISVISVSANHDVKILTGCSQQGRGKGGGVQVCGGLKPSLDLPAGIRDHLWTIITQLC